MSKEKVEKLYSIADVDKSAYIGKKGLTLIGGYNVSPAFPCNPMLKGIAPKIVYPRVISMPTNGKWEDYVCFYSNTNLDKLTVPPIKGSDIKKAFKSLGYKLSVKSEVLDKLDAIVYAAKSGRLSEEKIRSILDL